MSWSRPMRVWCLVLVGVLGPAPGIAEELCLEVLGRDPAGPSTAAAVGGGLGVWGLGSSLVVTDLSNPGQPRDIGSLMLPFAVTDVVLLGDRAVATAGRGLYEIDLQTPSQPRLAGVLEFDSHLRGLAGSGDVAMVIGGGYARVVNLATPGTPRALAVFNSPDPYGIGDVAVVGHHGYVVLRSGELRVLDLSNPWAPQQIAALPLSGGAWDTSVAAAGTRLGLRSSSDLSVVDIGDPAAPVLRGSITVRSSGMNRPVAIREDGALAYVTTPAQVGINTHTFVTTVDLANPAYPRRVAELDIEPGQPSALAAGGFTGRFVLDARQTTRLTLVADLAGTRPAARRIAASGPVVAVAGWNDEVRVFTVDGSGRPTEVARIPFEAAGLDK